METFSGYFYEDFRHQFLEKVKSTKSDHAIRYHSLHQNVYIRHFPGHTDRVTSLEMSPIEDQFLSCSTDRFETYFNYFIIGTLYILEHCVSGTCENLYVLVSWKLVNQLLVVLIQKELFLRRVWIQKL